jgi:hypothetical protein
MSLGPTWSAGPTGVTKLPAGGWQWGDRPDERRRRGKKGVRAPSGVYGYSKRDGVALICIQNRTGSDGVHVVHGGTISAPA